MSIEETLLELTTVEPGGMITQSLDPALNGYVKGNGAGVFTAVSTIPQSDIVLANDLAGLEGIGTTGIAVRSATDTWVTRTLTGTLNRISVANGSGVGGNPTIDIDSAYVGQASITTVGNITAGSWRAGIQLPTSLNVADNVFRVQGSADQSKQLALEVDGITAGQTRTWTVIDADGTFVGTTNAQAMSAKTITASSVDSSPVGASSAHTGAFTTFSATGAGTLPGSSAWDASGRFGFGAAAISNAQVRMRANAITASGVLSFYNDTTFAATAITHGTGFWSDLATAAAVFTCLDIYHYNAGSTTKGAGSSITRSTGFNVASAVAVAGATNYGFRSQLASAANTWNVYADGSAQNYFGGPIGILATDPLGSGVVVSIGAANSHPGSATILYGSKTDLLFPATTTSQAWGSHSTMRTAASAFTVGLMGHYLASTTIKGAGSAITSLYGFYASNAIAVGTNNYGFYSDINAAATTWQFYAAGTADSYFGGTVGILATNAAAQSNLLRIGGSATHPGAGATVQGINTDFTASSTASTAAMAYDATVRTAATAFTVTDVVGYRVGSVVKGAGSTITNVKGFWAQNAIAQGANNYGFYSDIALATTTWQLYMAGSGQSYFGGGVGLLDANPINSGRLLSIGGGTTHPATGTAVIASWLGSVAPATATTGIWGYQSQLSTAASAFTCGAVVHFDAFSTTKGGGSTITAAYGFRALNATAQGTTNYGFYSDIADATTTYQSYMGGTGTSFFNGSVGIGGLPTSTTHALRLNILSTMTGSTLYGTDMDITAPVTATANLRGHRVVLRTANSAFTTSLTLFFAEQAIKGAASTISNVYAFHAANAVAVGSNNYGFYSDINSAANTFQLNMAGTGLSQFTGGVILNSTAAPTVGASQVGLGATVAATASAGAGAAAPATVEGYWIINIAGTARKVPYYAT